MRAWRRGAGILALAALALPAAARADELLVMRYTCSMAGGQPVLSPGPEQGHRIIGPRDQRKFNACSPVNQGMCKQWTVHRFDLDCDGARVSWVSVVAATNEGSRRAWLLDGRLLLRMGPWWSLPPDDPCAREPDRDDRAGYRRMKRYCADQLAMAPPPVVEMPFGYAPMLGIDGIFVKAAPGIAGAPPLPSTAGAPPSKSAANELPQELFPAAPPASQRVEPPREPLVNEAPVKPLPPAAPQPPPQAAMQPPPPAAAHQPPQPLPKAAAPSASPPAAPPGATPPIVEAPKAAAAEAKPVPAAPNLGPRLVTPGSTPPKAVPAAPAATPPGSPGTTIAEIKPPASNAAPPEKAAASPPLPGAEDGASGLSLLSVFRATTTGALVAFAGLALGLLTAFALARRREHAQDARRRPRDLAAVSLDGQRGRPPPRIGNARGNLPPNAAAPAGSRAPGQPAAAGPLEELGDRMPRTRGEALQVLGMGVTPTATEAILKKIVDGLRQSWHPDHAKDDADRTLRELRSKQINVAWDLLRGQRAEV